MNSNTNDLDDQQTVIEGNVSTRPLYIKPILVQLNVGSATESDLNAQNIDFTNGGAS